MILDVPIYVSGILLIFVFLVYFLLEGLGPSSKKISKAKASDSKAIEEPAPITPETDSMQEAESESFPWDDVVNHSPTADGEQSYVVIRQFISNQRLIIKITTITGLISKIMLYAVQHCKITCFADNALEFSSLDDFYEYAELADKRLYECLLPVIDKGDKATAEELAKAILQYFDQPSCKATEVLNDWERKISKSNYDSTISKSYKAYIAQQKSDTFNPVADMEANVYVEYTNEFLLGFIVYSKFSDAERPDLFKIREELYVIDGHSAMALQKLLGLEPEKVYDYIVDKYAPFGTENIAALKTYLNDSHIDFEFSSERVLKVDPNECGTEFLSTTIVILRCTAVNM